MKRNVLSLIAACWLSLPASADWHQFQLGPQNGASGSAPMSQAALGATPQACSGGQWKQVGPAPETVDSGAGGRQDSGQVVDIAIDPRGSDDSTIYVATNGGIWKTANSGSSWATSTDCLATVRMGAVTLDAGNPSVVYAGTGNYFSSGFPIRGGIIYRSDDAGNTWSAWQLSQLAANNITRMVSPVAGQVLAATDGGLFRSTDRGQNFNLVLGGVITDLKIDTANSSMIYAAVAGAGVFRSTDDGKTFPENLFSSNNGAPTRNVGFVSFAQSRLPDNQTIYASVQDASSGGFLGLFKSTNGGSSWIALPQATVVGNGCQCGYDQTIGVDPQDSNVVYLGFVNLSASTDGGRTWRPIASEVHADHHALVFSPHPSTPGSRTPFYVGTDGGIAKTVNGTNFTNMNGVGRQAIASNLFGPPIDIGRNSPINNQYTYGGMQDTGTAQHRPEMGPLEWHQGAGADGDGNQVVVNPFNPAVAYSATGGAFMITTDGGKTWQHPASADTGLPDFRGMSVGRPILIDPVNPNNVYVISSPDHLQLFTSNNAGATFTLIHTFSSGVNANSTSMVAIDNNTMWVGLDNGRVAFSTNVLSGRSSTWQEMTVPNAPAKPARVAVDPTDTRRVVVVYDGVSGINASIAPTRHVFVTSNRGQSWTDISGVPNGGTNNLPDLPLYGVAINEKTTPHTIVVAGYGGVFLTRNEGNTWQAVGTGLPNVVVSSIALDTSADPPLLRAGTWGRSVLELEGPFSAPTNCFVWTGNCQHTATVVCDPTPDTLSLSVRIAGQGDWSPAGYTAPTFQNPMPDIVSDAPIGPGGDIRVGIHYEFQACAVNKAGIACSDNIPSAVPDPTGCPGGPPPPPPVPPDKCLKQGCKPLPGGRCLCQ